MTVTDERTLNLLVEAEAAELSWHPEAGGPRSWLVFEDDRKYDLGEDPNGDRLQAIVTRTLRGRYYPADAVRVTGRFVIENRDIRVGDRLVQQAPLFCRLGGPLLASAVEIFIVHETSETFSFGYVTTRRHLARGMWRADFHLHQGRLSVKVRSTSMPGSFSFWLGLPVARFLQVRARRRAIEEFRRL